MPVKKGRFIVLEGIDGAGTTTQLHRVRAALEARGERVLATCEPTDLPIGASIRSVLRGDLAPPPHDSIALLFAADRLDHLAREIQPALADGVHVLCDRYLGSSLAYQGSHCDQAWVAQINSHARLPDLTFYVRVSAETAVQRIGLRDGERRELFERKDTLERIAAAYDKVYGVTGEAMLDSIVVDGEQPADEVFYQLMLSLKAESSFWPT